MRHIRKCYNLRGRRVAFNPDREYLNEAIKEYLDRGGKVTVIRFQKRLRPINQNEMGDLREVDEFLLGRQASFL